MLARSIKDQMGSDLPRAIAALLYRRIIRAYRTAYIRQSHRRSRSPRGRAQMQKTPQPAPSFPSSPLVDGLVALARAERDSHGVQAIVDYNYDDLLEEQLVSQKVRCTTVLSGSQKVPDGSLPVYHVHGLVSIKDFANYLNSDRSKPMAAKGNFVFSEDEYHGEYSDPYKWSNMTQISHLGRYIGLFVDCRCKTPTYVG